MYLIDTLTWHDIVVLVKFLKVTSVLKGRTNLELNVDNENLDSIFYDRENWCREDHA